MTLIAEALRELLRRFKHYRYEPHRSRPKSLAMVCRSWRRLFSPLQWHRLPDMVETIKLHHLEKIVSSPLSAILRDHIHIVRLRPEWGNDDKDSSSRFLSAWRSLSRHLYQVIALDINWSSQSQFLRIKSSPISLRPCPRPLRHLTTLNLWQIAFPSFSALFRDIGALPSLKWLGLWGVEWNEACDPKSPASSSTATFSSMKWVTASDCTDDGWPVIWMFTASSLRYMRPWRAPVDGEDACTRPVRVDVLAIVQAFRWMRSSTRGSNRTSVLEYVDYAPKGNKSSPTKHTFHH